MVLLGAINLTNWFSVCKDLGSGFKIEASNKITLGNIFSKLCKACEYNKMASIPPSAFSAARIRATQREDRDVKLFKTTKRNETRKYFYDSFMELSPLKYNSKLMNSIWGLYNRYSPHNVKKVNESHALILGEMQQPAASSNKAEPVISLPAKFDNVWAAINVSQSH